MLDILMGQLVEEKSRWMYRRVDEAVQQQPAAKHLIVVPEQFTAQAEKAYLETTGRKGLMNPEVISFNRLAHRVFLETGGRTRVVIDDLGKHMLIRKLLLDVEKQLTLYRGLVREKGLIDRIIESITECKQYHVTADDLMRLASTLEAQPLLRGKLTDLAGLFQRYETVLADRYVDQEDQFLALIRQMKESEQLQQTICWIDGFFSFTPRMLSVILELVQHARHVHLTAYGKVEWLSKEDEPLVHQIRNLQKELKHRGEVAAVTDTDPLVARVAREKCLEHLVSCFNHLPLQAWKGKADALTLFAAANDDTEIEQVAARIQVLVQDHGYRYREIAVLCADLEKRQDSFKRYFTLQEIPFFLDARRKKIELPLARLVPALLENFIQGYSYQSMFRYLKTGYTGIPQTELENLENEVVARGIRGSAWKADFQDNRSSDQLSRVNALRRQIIKPLLCLEKKLSQSLTVQQMTDALFDWMEQAAIGRQVTEEVKGLWMRGDAETAALVTQLWNRMMTLADQLVELMGDAALSLAEYRQLWQTGLEAIEIGLIPPSMDQVMVGTPERSRQTGIRALFFIGVNDGVLPAAQNENGLFLFTEKQELHLRGCLMGVAGEFRQAQETLAIHLALGRPKEVLWLSYSQAGIEGETRRPSILLERIKKMFPDVAWQHDLIVREDQEMLLLRRPGYSYLKLADKLRELADGRPVSDRWVQLFYWFSTHNQWRVEAERLRNALFFQHQPSNLSHRHARDLFGTGYTGSVSRLEQYNRCPFAHFVTFGLHPSPRNKHEILLPDMGNVLHQIMESFGKLLEAQQVDPARLHESLVASMAETLANTVIGAYGNGIFNSSRRFHYQGERLKRVSRRSMETMVYHLKKSGFAPKAYERTFGSGDPEKQSIPFHIDTPQGKPVILQGRIDRVDTWSLNDRHYCRVIDYKSGRQPFSFLELMHGLQLQLIVYLMAVLNGHAGPILPQGTKPAGMFYFYLDDPLVELQENDPQQAAALIRQELKMQGALLRDVSIIKEMDREMEQESDVLPVGLTQSGGFRKGSCLLTESEFSALQQYAKNRIGLTAASILQGEIQVSPAQLKKWKACDHCEYGSICLYDPSFLDSRPRKLPTAREGDALGFMVRETAGKGGAE